jgi:hypothetical protein
VVQRFKEKIPVFEAVQWLGDADNIEEVSDWLTENEWPWLDGEQRSADPSPDRQQGHYIDPEGNQLVIIWPEDMNTVPIGHWIVKNRRYNYLEFIDNEEFNYKYETYGSDV